MRYEHEYRETLYARSIEIPFDGRMNFYLDKVGERSNHDGNTAHEMTFVLPMSNARIEFDELNMYIVYTDVVHESRSVWGFAKHEVAEEPKWVSASHVMSTDPNFSWGSLEASGFIDRGRGVK